jgi:integrase/recombinase XerC
VPLAVSSDFKNLKVREHLDAAEEAALQRAFAMAETEAEMDDDFSDQAPGPARRERKGT